MPQFKPFKGIRPINEIAGQFATKSVDAFKESDLELELRENPESFLHIIKPTWENAKDSSTQKHKLVAENFQEFLESDRVEKDRSSYYIYQITKPNKEKVKAMIGLVNMDDYSSGTIKIHEATLNKRVEVFAEYLQNIHFHAEPVLLTYPYNQRIDLLMDVEMKKKAVISFKDKDENQHQLWQIENRLNMQQIKDSIEKYENLYIADGHHRMESSLVYTQNMRKKMKGLTDADPIYYTLAMLVSDNELIIKDYNRIIKDLNGLSPEEFMEKLRANFEITERGETAFFPSKKHHIGMYLHGKFYSLFVKKEALNVKGLSELDTYLLEKLILNPILNIQNTRDDARIGFVRGTGNTEGVKEIKKAVDETDFEIGFFFYPVSAKDLEMIADLGLKMPPKSTYIEPKPLNGLTIFQLKE